MSCYRRGEGELELLLDGQPQFHIHDPNFMLTDIQKIAEFLVDMSHNK
jgi:hypothetical protein